MKQIQLDDLIAIAKAGFEYTPFNPAEIFLQSSHVELLKMEVTNLGYKLVFDSRAILTVFVGHEYINIDVHLNHNGSVHFNHYKAIECAKNRYVFRPEQGVYLTKKDITFLSQNLLKQLLGYFDHVKNQLDVELKNVLFYKDNELSESFLKHCYVLQDFLREGSLILQRMSGNPKAQEYIDKANECIAKIESIIEKL